MNRESFDSLHWVKRAQQAGFTQSQAEFQIKSIGKLIRCLATRKDLENLAVATKKDFENFVALTKKEIENLFKTTKKDLENLEEKLTAKLMSKMTARLGGMITGAAVVIPVFFRLLQLIH